MQIQVNTDNQTEGSASLTDEVQVIIEEKFSHFADRITRVEVHLNDENSHVRSGGDDKGCQIEVRLAGMEPISVSDHSTSHDLALRGAANKMKHMLETTLGKLATH